MVALLPAAARRPALGWVALLAQPTWSIATQFQGLTAPGHPEVRWAYAVFDVSLVLSALVAGFGGLPLWLLMLCRDGREHRLRDLVYLLLPLIAPAAYLAALIVTIRLVGGTLRVSPWWFLVVTLAGFAAAATAAAGPGLALRRLQPRGPALRLAAAAAGLAAAVMAVAAVAIVVAVIGLCLWEAFTSPATIMAPSPAPTWRWSWPPRPSPRSAPRGVRAPR